MTAREVTPTEARALIDAGALLLDVRESYEWAEGHAPDALHVPMSELNARADEIDRDRTVVCMCHVGQRSAVVADALTRAGWDAVNLAGGMEAWQQSGLPVVQ